MLHFLIEWKRFFFANIFLLILCSGKLKEDIQAKPSKNTNASFFSLPIFYFIDLIPIVEISFNRVYCSIFFREGLWTVAGIFYPCPFNISLRKWNPRWETSIRVVKLIKFSVGKNWCDLLISSQILWIVIMLCIFESMWYCHYV